jgi:uncharacterized protein
MPCEELIVADSSPLIGLARIGYLALLRRLARRVSVPPAVWEEITGADRADAREISQQTWIEVITPSAADVARFSSTLDRGEAEAVALAIQEKKAVLLIDDLQGRRVASQLKIRHFGTIALLGQAKREGLVPKVKPLLDGLTANGIYISQTLIERALRELGE